MITYISIQWRAVTSETSHAIGMPKPGHRIGYIQDQFSSDSRCSLKKGITSNHFLLMQFSSQKCRISN